MINVLFFNPRKEVNILKDKSIVLLSRFVDLFERCKHQNDPKYHWFYQCWISHFIHLWLRSSPWRKANMAARLVTGGLWSDDSKQDVIREIHRNLYYYYILLCFEWLKLCSHCYCVVVVVVFGRCQWFFNTWGFRMLNMIGYL